MAMTEQKRKPQGKPQRNYPDVANLRRRMGELAGKKRMSRVKFAKLINAAPGSIYNWERGHVPSRVYISKLNELAKSVRTGQFNQSEMKAGKTTPPAKPKIKSSSTKKATSDQILGEVATVYANRVLVSNGGDEVRLLFGLQPPGDGSARAAASVLIPKSLLRQIAAAVH